MADWATLDAELPPLIGRLLELPCDWRKRPRTMKVGASAQLDIIAEGAIGVDDRKWVDQSSGDVSARVTGQRVMTLQVTVWAAVQPLARSARRYLERLRLRLRFPSTLDALAALELALVDTEALVQLDPAEDGRTVSQASLDVRLAYALDDDDEPIPTIERAEVAGRIPPHEPALSIPEVSP